MNCRINDPVLLLMISSPHQEYPSLNKSAFHKLAHKFLHMFANQRLPLCDALSLAVLFVSKCCGITSSSQPFPTARDSIQAGEIRPIAVGEQQRVEEIEKMNLPE